MVAKCALEEVVDFATDSRFSYLKGSFTLLLVYNVSLLLSTVLVDTYKKR